MKKDKGGPRVSGLLTAAALLFPALAEGARTVEEIERLRCQLALVVSVSLLALLFVITVFCLALRSARKKSDLLRRRLERLAVVDEETGTFNRNHGLRRFEEEYAEAQRLERPLGCLLIHFGQLESLEKDHGRETAAEVLRYAASSLTGSVRTYDILSRYGDTEFLLILPETNYQNTGRVAEKIGAMLEATPVYHRELPEPLALPAEIGYAVYEEGDRGLDDILGRAKKALAEARREKSEEGSIRGLRKSHGEEDAGS